MLGKVAETRIKIKKMIKMLQRRPRKRRRKKMSLRNIMRSEKKMAISSKLCEKSRKLSLMSVIKMTKAINCPLLKVQVLRKRNE